MLTMNKYGVENLGVRDHEISIHEELTKIQVSVPKHMEILFISEVSAPLIVIPNHGYSASSSSYLTHQYAVAMI